MFALRVRAADAAEEMQDGDGEFAMDRCTGGWSLCAKMSEKAFRNMHWKDSRERAWNENVLGWRSITSRRRPASILLWGIRNDGMPSSDGPCIGQLFSWPYGGPQPRRKA